jgi:biotin operon repressor
VSVHVSSWAWKQQAGDPGSKLVLVKLAENADDNGYSFWRQQRLAAECEMSRATVQRKIRLLVEKGFVEVIERRGEDGKVLANGYRIVPTAVPQSDQPVPHLAEARTVPHSYEAARTVDQEQPTTTRARERKPDKVDKVKVTDAEHDLTDGIMASFNEVFGTKYAGVGFRRGIIGRIREHPGLGLSDHEAIMRRMKARPWWKGEPSPAVIYGNDRAFERALHTPDPPPEEDRQSYGFG